MKEHYKKITLGLAACTLAAGITLPSNIASAYENTCFPGLSGAVPLKRLIDRGSLSKDPLNIAFVNDIMQNARIPMDIVKNVLNSIEEPFGMHQGKNNDSMDKQMMASTSCQCRCDCSCACSCSGGCGGCWDCSYGCWECGGSCQCTCFIMCNNCYACACSCGWACDCINSCYGCMCECACCSWTLM